VVVCLEQGADLHMSQLMPLPLTVSCFSKIQIGFTFLVPAHLCCPGQRAVKRLCVCVCVCVVCVQDRQLYCAQQLKTSSRPMGRIKLKVFGSSGVGKTALIESLKCGYLGGLLRSTFRSPSSSTVVADTPASVCRSTNPGMHVHHFVSLMAMGTTTVGVRTPAKTFT